MPKERRKKKKVIVAMSGGVDSSIAAALLEKNGFEVIGAFMKFWRLPISLKNKEKIIRHENKHRFLEAEERARAVAGALNIPFYVFDFSKEFKKEVVDYFLKEYQLGRTPNPCVVCNKEIKLGLLLKKLPFLDADYIATGHYVRLISQNLKKTSRNRSSNFKIFKILKGKDKSKDQSYFLWRLNQRILSRVLFPLGEYKKEEVRKLAQKFKLPNYNAPESQEICFIQTTVNDFLKKFIKFRPGKIIDDKKRVVGTHQGLWFYTIGQRKGIGISSNKPYYVLDKDVKRNLIIVTQDERKLFKRGLITKDINWILKPLERFPFKLEVKIRYKNNPVSATIIKENKIIFDKPQRAVTPGQSVVFYKKQELLGGGIIYKPL